MGASGCKWMTSPPGTLVGAVPVLLRRALPKRGEGEAHVGPHPGHPPGEEHHYHVLKACGQGCCGSHSYGSVAPIETSVTVLRSTPAPFTTVTWVPDRNHLVMRYFERNGFV